MEKYIYMIFLKTKKGFILNFIMNYTWARSGTGNSLSSRIRNSHNSFSRLAT